MAIERDQKLKMHKNLVIRCLREHPEDVRQMAPGYTGTAEELIKELESHPGQWIVNGELSESE